jgi:hypothetical protein
MPVPLDCGSIEEVRKMAASEFAKRLAKHLPEASFIGGTALKDYVPRQRMIDAELQEVREALTRMQRLPVQSPPCWCIQWWPDGHDGVCNAARALWSKLEVKE